jgi:hypothetical protein
MKHTESFVYLGFHLGSRLSFRNMLNGQLMKLQKSYTIFKRIHPPFSAAYQLKQRVFDTYVWRHIFILATIDCLMLSMSQKQLSGCYQRCLPVMYCVFQCATLDLIDFPWSYPHQSPEWRKLLWIGWSISNESEKNSWKYSWWTKPLQTPFISTTTIKPTYPGCQERHWSK